MRLRTKYTQRLPTAPGLVLDIPMFEGSGTKVLDLSGKGNHGTITGAVWARNEYGVALSFNGIFARIDCGNDSSLNIAGPISIEAGITPKSEREYTKFDILSSFPLPDGFVGYQGVAVNATHIFVLDSTDAAHQHINNHIRKYLKNGTLVQTKEHTECIIITANGAIRSGNGVTITANESHHYSVGDMIYIDGVDDSSFNGGGFTITSVPTSTTFIYNQTGNDANSGNGWISEIENIRYWHGYSDGNIIDDKLYVTVCKSGVGSVIYDDFAVLVYDPTTLNLIEEYLITGRTACPEGIDKHGEYFWIVYWYPDGNKVDKFDTNFNFIESYALAPLVAGEQTIVCRGSNILVHQHSGFVHEYSFDGSKFTLIRYLPIGAGVPLAKGVNEGEEDIYYQAYNSNDHNNKVKRLKYLSVIDDNVPGLIANKYGGSAGYYFSKSSSSPFNKLKFIFYDEDGAYTGGDSAIIFEHDVRNHVAVTYDGTLKFYINDAEDIRATYNKNIKLTAASISALIGILRSSDWPLCGIIDGVRIYAVGLTENAHKRRKEQPWYDYIRGS